MLTIVQIDILIILIPLSVYAFKNPDIGTSAVMAFLVWNIFVGLLNNVLKPILLAKGVESTHGNHIYRCYWWHDVKRYYWFICWSSSDGDGLYLIHGMDRAN